MPHVHIVTNVGGAHLKRQPSSSSRPLRISTLARRNEIDPRRVPIICALNGVVVSQKRWRYVTARRDDVIEFVVMPRGGATFRTIASLAVLVVAAIAAPQIAGLFFAAGTVAFTAATVVTTAALPVGGGYYVDATAHCTASQTANPHATTAANA